MRRLRKNSCAVCLVAIVGVACGEATDETSTSDPFVALGPSFVADPSVRREALVQSLVDPTNGYAQLRLQSYGLGGSGWDVLPVANPDVRPIRTDEIGTFDDGPRAAAPFSPIFEADTHDWSASALYELGRRAFHGYPVEVSHRFGAGLKSEQDRVDVGYWKHDDRVGGIVRVRNDYGYETFASTCSTCHASVIDQQLVDGRTNAAFDSGALSRRLVGGHGSDWGPGIADVTADGRDNPAAITDLRPIAHQSRLHWAATLHNSPAALAVRIETLLITAANEQTRPPREVVLGLAHYLWSLGNDVSKVDRTAPGAALYAQNCATCHGYESVTQPAVPLAMVGTDPAVGESLTRGTGTYRVPSLRGASTRSQLLHDGSVASLRELLDPDRLAVNPGHAFGMSLSEGDRDQLIAFVESL